MNLYDIWFSTIKLPDEIKNQIMRSFRDTEELWVFLNEHKDYNYSFSTKPLLASMNMEYVEKLLEITIKQGIKIVTKKDDDYPRLLKNYDDSPYVLYYFGNIKKINELRNISIVGSRLCSNYGKEVTNIITSQLSFYNVNIVSGMAKGIDSVAHWGAVNNGAFSTAVLGCGIDRIYPAENRSLYNKIKEIGCIISQFPTSTPPFAYNFPIRNRIISGMSELIIVVEAEKRSGSLITANRALDQSKHVMAVPGSIFSSKSKGTHDLISDGAHIFTGIESILSLLKINFVGKQKKKVKRRSKEMEKIYSILTDTPMHLDDIMRITNIDIKLLYELLLEMQLEDSIKCIAGNYYVKINDDFQ
ncbi:MAG: DNA-protecting protein DprA [Clostridiales bacterium]|nr:DNA-protecting protein DprA [Clostridiales bacterium]